MQGCRTLIILKQVQWALPNYSKLYIILDAARQALVRRSRSPYQRLSATRVRELGGRRLEAFDQLHAINCGEDSPRSPNRLASCRRWASLQCEPNPIAFIDTLAF